MDSKIISRKQLCEITGLSYPTIWRLEKAGNFPKRIKLSPGRVGWYLSAAQAWLESRQTVEG